MGESGCSGLAYEAYVFLRRVIMSHHPGFLGFLCNWEVFLGLCWGGQLCMWVIL